MVDAHSSFQPITVPPPSPGLISPRFGTVDISPREELFNLKKAIQRLQSANGQNVTGAVSVSSTTPQGISKWYSQQSFKVITFFLFCVTTLGIITAGLFTDKLSTDQFLGMLSSLLFLMAPSPLELIKKKKKESIRIT